MRVRNSIYKIAQYFGEPDTRFMDFWKSLSQEEKEYYGAVDLTTGKMPEIFRATDRVRVINENRRFVGLVGRVWETSRPDGQTMVCFDGLGILGFMDNELERA